MARTAQINNEKRQSIITLGHDKNHDEKTHAMMKLALMRTATGKEDTELPLLQRIRSLELTAPQIAAQINASQSSSNRHISTSSVQRRLLESGLHGRINAKKPLLKDTNRRKDWLGPRNMSNGHYTCGNLSFGLMSPNVRILVPTALSL